MPLDRRTVAIMSGACATNVANMYYCQPLLADMSRSLGLGADGARYLPMWTQAGVALGMLAFVPLGDMLPRRELICAVAAASAVTAFTMAAASSLSLVYAAGFFTGVTAIVSHLILPFAAKLAPAEKRGHVLGTILGTMLTGILLARVVSGFVGDIFGWRTMYVAAGVMMCIVVAVLRVALPHDEPEPHLRYGQLLRSIANLVRTQPGLREAAITGGMTFGAFSSFWATLVFFVSTPPWHYGAPTAGMFGLVGAAGAIAAAPVGRLSDRKGPRFTLLLAILSCIVSWFVFYFFGYYLAGLIVGVILLDLGVQSSHVSNQTRIYTLLPEARSRANTVYMFGYFIGGGIGSALGAYGWSRFGWTGVCAAGVVQLLVGLAARLSGPADRQQHRSSI